MYSLASLLIFLVLQQASAEDVKISVYYESLCPDSKAFIDDQLFPTYKSIGDDIKPDLIPFGNAKMENISGTIEFTCQHGPEECYGNEIHSCAIALYSVEESTEFIYCSMSSDAPSSDDNLEKCANATGISWNSLKTCYTSGQGDKLLEENGDRTLKAQPAITFVPTVVFNDHYNETLQNEAVTDLKAVVCRFLDYEPSVCQTYVYDNVEVKLVL